MLIIGDRRTEWADVPKQFWWAEGNVALEQNWKAGDFSNWIEHKHHLQAFGVSFALSGLLEFVEFEKRAQIAQSLSVAGNKDWITAHETRRYFSAQSQIMNPSGLIIEQAKLGFVTARAVHAQGTKRGRDVPHTIFDEREWDIPPWFWTEFTKPDASNQDWELGKFSGRGSSPMGHVHITLSAVHFLKASIEGRFGIEAEPEEFEMSLRGRKPKYDWAGATNAIWGQLYNNDLKPQAQADIERALIAFLRKGDAEPGESTVRPYAAAIWDRLKEN
ncbi:MAG: hypothetical protein KUG65_05360 [Sphingomonadaceae bacterium]|nr:hypothetical protein [Sphingomonadaceae bacterium]